MYVEPKFLKFVSYCLLMEMNVLVGVREKVSLYSSYELNRTDRLSSQLGFDTRSCWCIYVVWRNCESGYISKLSSSSSITSNILLSSWKTEKQEGTLTIYWDNEIFQAPPEDKLLIFVAENWCLCSSLFDYDNQVLFSYL